MVVHIYNPSTQEEDTEFEDSLDYTVIYYLRENKLKRSNSEST